MINNIKNKIDLLNTSLEEKLLQSNDLYRKLARKIIKSNAPELIDDVEQISQLSAEVINIISIISELTIMQKTKDYTKYFNTMN